MRPPLVFTVAAFLAFVAAGTPAPAVLGIDHVPVAVNDLEAASERYRALGFTLKPGRPHANGIRNQHAKFPDGTEIELITAPAATDSLTRKYRDHLQRGDGPAFLALFAPDQARANTINGGSVPYVFFGPRQASPTDRPEHFAHANTAYSLTEVWLAGDDLAAERKLLTALGAQLRVETIHVPDRVRATVAAFPQGTVCLLPGKYQVVTGRPIVGLTVLVKDVREASRILGKRARAGRSGGSLFLGPEHTAGYWLEFRSQ